MGLAAYWKSLDASLHFNIKKRSEFLIRSKFRMLKAKAEDNKPDQTKSSGCEDSQDDMQQFFQRHSGENDRFHWRRTPSGRGRFMLPRVSMSK